MNISKLIINNKQVKFPIIQGGMGIRISLGKLARACMKSGIVSTISMAQIGFLRKDFKTNPLQANLDELALEIDQIRNEEPNGVLGVNVMYAITDYDKYLTFLSNQNIDFVISGAGLPLDMPVYLKNSKVKGAFIVSSGRACSVLLRSWDKKHQYMPEFIVCEGPLAGGHLGFKKEDFDNGNVPSLEDIVLEVKEIVGIYEEKYQKHIPVIAAGGVHNGKDIARFIKLGCDGVQMATRFIATEECDASSEYKEAIINSKEEDIVRVASPAGLPGRAIKNYLTETLKKMNIKKDYCVNCLKSCNKVNIPYCITEQLGSSASGNKNGLIFTGAKAHLIKRLQTVEELVTELIKELKLEINMAGGTL